MDNEELEFFDALDQIVQEPDLFCVGEYDVWTHAPQSVKERRRDFIQSMGLDLGELEKENPVEIFNSHRIMETSAAVLRIPEDESSSSHPEDMNLNKCRNENLNFSECIVDGTGGREQFENFSRFSPSDNQFVLREIEDNASAPRRKSKSKIRWLRKLHSMTCIKGAKMKDDDVGPSGFSRHDKRIKKIKVRHSRRRSKEISALFSGQDIEAHKGAILAMKFSLDGKYLASAGEDKNIRIWQVVEDERLNMDYVDTLDLDPSCVYFSANHLSELGPLKVEKEMINKSKSSIFRRTQDSTCVVFPPKLFRILEKPLHVFEGHEGEILGLSWSRNNCLLSSSVDKTVRLWRPGVDHCIKVFPHSDYVTSIQFNPVNDDYFISGSIDGKVRIWAIGDCKVVDWAEITDIITAVCYSPDGQSGMIGSLTGTCRFFDLSGNLFQLGAKVWSISKKKSPCKRITSFQFSPRDPTKVLVTCADSKVRIIDGMNVIEKYKGLRNAGNQISASFTSDGKHIVSASDDSSIYMWNHCGQFDPSLSKPKAVKSFECFTSDASIVAPWPGLKTNGSTSLLPLSCLYECFLVSKGSATWPEEKLPITSPPKSLTKSECKLVKNSWESLSESHAWGLVIVTAGWDGRIRWFQNYSLPVPV